MTELYRNVSTLDNGARAATATFTARGVGDALVRTLWNVTLPAARFALIDGMLLCNARALGEFGAVSVISGHIDGATMTVPLQIENLYNDGLTANAFALALGLAVVTIVLSFLRTHLQREGKRLKEESFVPDYQI